MIDKSKKNILITASTFPRWSNDSVPTFVYDHALNLSGEYNVFVIAPHFKGAKFNEEIEGLYVKRFPYFFPFRLENIAYSGLKSNGGLSSTIKAIPFGIMQLIYTLYITIKYNCIIINAHWLIPQGFIALLVTRLLRRKLIVSVHGGDIFTLNKAIYSKIKKIVLKNADIVITNSSITKNACLDIHERDYIVIPPVVRSSLFTEDVYRKKINNDNVFNILFVGRVSEEKGIIYLLQAIQSIKTDKCNIKLSVVGDGPQIKYLKSWSAKNGLNNIDFAGWQNGSQLIEYYKQADIFVGPSIRSESGWVEAFGIVFVEAGLAGLPVITSDMGGQTDIVIDGETGFIVTQKNYKALAEKIEVLINDDELRLRMAHNARKRCVKLYSSESSNELFNKAMINLKR